MFDDGSIFDNAERWIGYRLISTSILLVLTSEISVDTLGKMTPGQPEDPM